MNYKQFLLVSAVFLAATLVVYSKTTYAEIFFKEDPVNGWNGVDSSTGFPNNDVGGLYTKQQIKDFLTSDSTSLWAQAINSKKCYIQVVKGCHQPSDPHITLNSRVPTGRDYKKFNDCNLGIAGSNNIHVKCP